RHSASTLPSRVLCLFPLTFHSISTSSHFSFFFNDTATPEIYTLSLHDALPFSGIVPILEQPSDPHPAVDRLVVLEAQRRGVLQRSEEHTSELQSRGHLVCRLLLEKKKYTNNSHDNDCNKATGLL